MRIAVAGGTGFIGRHLIRAGASSGHEMILISRDKLRVDGTAAVASWDELSVDPSPLEGVDAIVNLSGESINQRWSQSAKERIVSSRIQTATRVAKLVNALSRKPEVVVNGSGMSIYGVSETEVFDESSPARMDDFLAGVVKKWEEAADRIQGVRLVKLRIGIVLGMDGGALPKMLLPYRLGVGGRIGSGRQWLSWIHIDDMVRAIFFCIEQGTISGPVNATAPAPVTNGDFGRAVARAMRRPHYFPVPAFAFRMLFGEMADLLLQGQHVVPGKLLEHGFVFHYADIDSAMANLVAGEANERAGERK